MDAVIAATDHQSNRTFEDLPAPTTLSGEAEIAARRRARARIGCDLLLAQLFKHHPDHAMAALKGVKPRVVDLEPPEEPSAPSENNAKNIVVLPLRFQAHRQTALDDMSLIHREVADFYDIRVVDICSGKRNEIVAHARKVSIYLAKTMTKLSLRSIGLGSGGRDNSTVRHYIGRMEKQLLTDERLRDEMDVLILRVRQAFLNRNPEKQMAN